MDYELLCIEGSQQDQCLRQVRMHLSPMRDRLRRGCITVLLGSKMVPLYIGVKMEAGEAIWSCPWAQGLLFYFHQSPHPYLYLQYNELFADVNVDVSGICDIYCMLVGPRERDPPFVEVFPLFPGFFFFKS